MQKQGHRVSGTVGEEGLGGGVATMDGRRQGGMGRKIAGGKDA